MLVSIELEVENVHQIAEQLGLTISEPRPIGFETSAEVALLQDRLEEARKLNQGLQYQVDTLTAQVHELRVVVSGKTFSEPPPGAVAAGGVEVDDHGTPYDPAIHSSSRSLNKDGSWRARKGGPKTGTAPALAARTSIDDATPAEFDAAHAVASAPTVNDVRNAIRSFMAPIIAAAANPDEGKKVASEQAKKIFARFKKIGTDEPCAVITDLQPEQFAAVIAALKV